MTFELDFLKPGHSNRALWEMEATNILTNFGYEDDTSFNGTSVYGIESFSMTTSENFQYMPWRDASLYLQKFIIYFYPVLAIQGLLGIFLILTVLLKHKVVPDTTRMWLISLCVADLMVITIAGSRMWHSQLTGNFSSYRDTNKYICAAHLFLAYFSNHLSSWIQSGMYVERVIVTFHPIKARLWLSRNKNLVILIILVVIITFLNLPLLIFGRLTTNAINRTSCYVKLPESYTGKLKIKTIIYHIDFIAGCLLPLLLILIGSIIIIYTLQKQTFKHQLLNYTNISELQKRRKQHRRMSKTLLGLNIFFIICNYPFTISLQFLSGETISQNDFYKNQFIFTLLSLLTYVNNCTNWAIFCLTGSAFRKYIKQQLTCRKNDGSSSTKTGL